MRRVTLPLLDKLPLISPSRAKPIPVFPPRVGAGEDVHHEHAWAGKPGAVCCGECRRTQPVAPITLPNE